MKPEKSDSIYSIRYKERVMYPPSVRVIVVLAAVLFVWILMLTAVSSVRGKLIISFPSISFLLSIAIPALILVHTLATLKIRISNGVLKIRGYNPSDRFHIPLTNVISCKLEDHQYPFWRGFFLSTSYEGPEGSRILCLPGYQGKGVLLEYQEEGILSGKKEMVKIHFPSNNPETIIDLISK
jgi:hypothetical protein